MNTRAPRQTSVYAHIRTSRNCEMCIVGAASAAYRRWLRRQPSRRVRDHRQRQFGVRSSGLGVRRLRRVLTLKSALRTPNGERQTGRWNMVEMRTRHALPMLLALAAAAPAAAQQTVRLPARDVALQERPATVFTVGTEEGRDWEMFSGIRTVAFDRSDNLYVLDGQNYRVVVFDARGRYVRHFGKRGGGPGELQAPLALVINTDGNVVVND